MEARDEMLVSCLTWAVTGIRGEDRESEGEREGEKVEKLVVSDSIRKETFRWLAQTRAISRPATFTLDACRARVL